MWIADSDDDLIYAYDVSSITVKPKVGAGLRNPQDIWIDGSSSIAWVSSQADKKIRAYSHPSGVPLHQYDMDLSGVNGGNTMPRGIEGRGTQMWVVDAAPCSDRGTTGKCVRAFSRQRGTAGTLNPNNGINLVPENSDPFDIVFENNTYYVLDSTAGQIFAYNASNARHQPHLDIKFGEPGQYTARGLRMDERTAWVSVINHNGFTGHLAFSRNKNVHLPSYDRAGPDGHPRLPSRDVPLTGSPGGIFSDGSRVHSVDFQNGEIDSFRVRSYGPTGLPEELRGRDIGPCEHGMMMALYDYCTVRGRLGTVASNVDAPTSSNETAVRIEPQGTRRLDANDYYRVTGHLIGHAVLTFNAVPDDPVTPGDQSHPSRRYSISVSPPVVTKVEHGDIDLGSDEVLNQGDVFTPSIINQYAHGEDVPLRVTVSHLSHLTQAGQGSYDIHIRPTDESRRPGGYTIEATTYDADQSGDFRLTISGLGGEHDPSVNTGDECVQRITGDGALTGTWAPGCESAARGGSHARFFTFRPDEESDITILLERTSGDADTYLYVREGEARAGDPLFENDDFGSYSRSRIMGTFQGGAYESHVFSKGHASGSYEALDHKGTHRFLLVHDSSLYFPGYGRESYDIGASETYTVSANPLNNESLPDSFTIPHPDDRRIYETRFEILFGALVDLRQRSKEFHHDHTGYYDVVSGIWSDGETMWVLLERAHWYYEEGAHAFDLATGARVPEKDVHVTDDTECSRAIFGPPAPRDSYVLIMDVCNDAAHAYSFADSARVPEHDLPMQGLDKNAIGLWGTGGLVRLSEIYANTLRAYDLWNGAGRVPGQDKQLPHDAVDLWSDGVRLWIAEFNPNLLIERPRLTMMPFSERDAKHIPTVTYHLDQENDEPRGIWSNGETMWVADNDSLTVYAYCIVCLPDEIELRVNRSGVIEDAGPKNVRLTAELIGGRPLPVDLFISVELLHESDYGKFGVTEASDVSFERYHRLIIPAGQRIAEHTFQVTPVDDDLKEGLEKFTIRARARILGQRSFWYETDLLFDVVDDDQPGENPPCPGGCPPEANAALRELTLSNDGTLTWLPASGANAYNLRWTSGEAAPVQVTTEHQTPSADDACPAYPCEYALPDFDPTLHYLAEAQSAPSGQWTQTRYDPPGPHLPAYVQVTEDGLVSWPQIQLDFDSQVYFVRWTHGNRMPEEIARDGSSRYGESWLDGNECETSGICRLPIPDFDPTAHYLVQVRAVLGNPLREWALGTYAPNN